MLQNPSAEYIFYRVEQDGSRHGKSKNNKLKFYNPVSGDKSSFRKAIRNAMESTTPQATFLNRSDLPVSVTLKHHMPRPKAHYIHNRDTKQHDLSPHAPILVTKTPDIDNLNKLVLDAMTTVECKDDSVVAHIHAKQVWWAPNKKTFDKAQKDQGHTTIAVTQMNSISKVANCK